MPLTGARAEDTDTQMIADLLRRVRRLEQRKSSSSPTLALDIFTHTFADGVISITSPSGTILKPSFTRTISDPAIGYNSSTGAFTVGAGLWYVGVDVYFDGLTGGTEGRLFVDFGGPFPWRAGQGVSTPWTPADPYITPVAIADCSIIDRATNATTNTFDLVGRGSASGVLINQLVVTVAQIAP